MSGTDGRREIRIGLLWHSVNSRNLGVGALTVGNMALARTAAAAAGLSPRFLVIAPHDSAPAYVAGPDIDFLWITASSMLSPNGIWRAIGQLDCVLDIGAGDSFADIYGPKRFAYIWMTKMVALARRCPLMLSPQTIGPFTKPVYRALAVQAVRGARLTVARDPMSYAEIGRLAPSARRLLAADVAFRLPFTRPAARDGSAVIDIGVNVSGLLWEQSQAGSNDFNLSYDYGRFTRGLLEALAARPDVRVHLITHANHPLHAADDDGHVADALAADYPAFVRVPNFASPSAAKSYIAGLDFLVAARMHACIAAFSAGVPVVPVAYSRKFIGLFQGVLDYAHVLPVAGIDADEACAFVLARIDRRRALADEVEAGNMRVAPLLDGYVAALTEMFGRIVAK